MRIATWWSDYAEQIGLNAPGVPEAQRIEMRRAFYAGVAALLSVQKSHISDLSDDEGALALETIEREYRAFFRNGGMS